MSGQGRIQAIAIGAAMAAFVLLLLALRLRSWFPFLGAILTYLAVLIAYRPVQEPRRELPLPDGVSRDDYDTAVDRLAKARRQLYRLAAGAPPADVPMIERMAELIGAIRLHHESNPAHVPRTRLFVRHTLGRMVAAVAGYVDLARRASPEQDDRLADVSRQIESFVPALEKIDRACVENDLMALEINVEVLNDQLGRDD